MATITLNGMEYELACNLRVAYQIQNQHNHKAYSEVLSNVGKMTLEEQLDVLYASFSVANKEVAKTISKEAFRTYFLDDPNFNVNALMALLKSVIAGIMGKDEKELFGDKQNKDEESAKNE